MAKIIIFGIKDLAELANVYLSTDSEHEVVAFCVHKEFIPPKKEFKGLPVIDFDQIHIKFPPSKFSFFAPMTHSLMNKNRERVYNEIKSKNYNLISYISSRAILSKEIKIGDNCFILENVIIQPFVKIGNNNIIWANTLISHHSIMADHIFLAPSVSISGNCKIESNCFLGIGSLIRDNLKIGQGSFIAMGACVIHDTLPQSLYVGTPAKRMGDIPCYLE